MNTWRKLSDGSLLAPRRGKAPACPDGYKIREGSGGFVVVPILVDCENRQKKSTGCKTCKREVLYCNVINKKVNPGTCHECKAQPEWVINHDKQSV